MKVFQVSILSVLTPKTILLCLISGEVGITNKQHNSVQSDTSSQSPKRCGGLRSGAAWHSLRKNVQCLTPKTEKPGKTEKYA